jgi:hypothetical protein
MIICEDYFFEIVYSRMVSMAGAFDEVRIRFENLDMMYAEETMYMTIEGCRPVSERLYFPIIKNQKTMNKSESIKNITQAIIKVGSRKRN